MIPFSKTALPLLLIIVVLTNALLAFSKSPNLNRNKHATENAIRRKRDSPAKVPVQWKRGTIPETNVKLDSRSPEMVKMPKELKDGESETSPSQQKRKTPAKVPRPWKRETKNIPETNVVKLLPRSSEKAKVQNPISNGRSKASSSQQKRNSPAKVPVQWKRGTSKLPERNVKLDPRDEDDQPASQHDDKRDNQRNPKNQKHANQQVNEKRGYGRNPKNDKKPANQKDQGQQDKKRRK
ncbi:uncharacterized protein FA14DRAFT_184348 [Meira miltonrushii]|uniref:Uncharacterized protein n=1 Tax=Meira miltonrushii TaxID=1280837 RepID=A0A316VG92_9BASI|nr:uncharacterized protein FA14DRAFT_184348 [Meira miltonrushii]PWN35021.1 hypothetical protein FA14DRAFT_184348 [Meira miltonrushii]